MIPCPECCTPTCIIGSDLFDDDLSQWTEFGLPAVAGGLLLLSPGDSVIFTPAPATANDGVRVQTFPLCADLSGTVRLIVAWLDNDNYLFGEFTFGFIFGDGVGSIQLGEVVEGEETYIGEPQTVADIDEALNGRSTITLCWQPGEVQEGEAGDLSLFPSGAIGDDWTDPTNIFATDGASAQWAGPFNAGDVTGQISGDHFGFPIPPGSTIDGIEVELYHADLSSESDYVIDWIVRLIDRTGTPVGDNKAGLSLIGGSAPQFRGYGGATDKWNAGITWRDAVHENFGVAVAYKNDGPDNQATVILDSMAVILHFTTPDRTPGRLVFSYRNNTSPNDIQCVRSLDATSSGGLKTGIGIPLSSFGDWDFTEYDLQYLQHATLHPDCLTCNCTATVVCECFEAVLTASDAYIVDLGTDIALTDDPCDGCSEVGGEYLLEATASEGGFVGCQWGYIGEGWNCDPLLPNGWAPWFSLFLRKEGDICIWQFWMRSLGLIFYQSDPIDPEDCQTMPVTLTLVDPPGGFFGGCDGFGSLPATITLEAAP